MDLPDSYSSHDASAIIAQRGHFQLILFELGSAMVISILSLIVVFLFLIEIKLKCRETCNYNLVKEICYVYENLVLKNVKRDKIPISSCSSHIYPRRETKAYRKVCR